METFFRNKKIVNLINKWKVHLIIITIVAIAIGAFISSPIVITPKFKSLAIIYPVNTYTYSKESTTEQMLQVLNSNDIKEKMLAAFDLLKHYKIDPKEPQYYTYFLDEYNSNVNINKTEYESVEITVLDKNSKIACQMVDSIVKFYDDKIASLHKRKQKEVIEISRAEFVKKKHELDSLESIVKNYRQNYGIMNYNSQVLEATKGEFAGNNQAKELFKNLQEYGVDYQRLDPMLYNVRKEVIDDKHMLEVAYREYNKHISYSQIISTPYPADKKSYPIRWIVVAITVITSLIFSIIVIAVIESKQKA
ncbi:MAG: hypothetical protein COZ59_09490 [Bacteroidetes bacterium CG_4_8_14_3_um_filter_31_14]|nr:MAG: hypothetical protein COZ59_09490 [Bacteroidetes bacterium CG_4_8_14_3_um_filter_31_14]